MLFLHCLFFVVCDSFLRMEDDVAVMMSSGLLVVVVVEIVVPPSIDRSLPLCIESVSVQCP